MHTLHLNVFFNAASDWVMHKFIEPNLRHLYDDVLSWIHTVWQLHFNFEPHMCVVHVVFECAVSNFRVLLQRRPSMRSLSDIVLCRAVLEWNMCYFFRN